MAKNNQHPEDTMVDVEKGEKPFSWLTVVGDNGELMSYEEFMAQVAAKKQKGSPGATRVEE